ncbi:MAG: RNA pseudouridine synthase, partial [Pseudomonadota bacterium]
NGLPGVSFEAGGVLVVRAPLGRHRTDRQRMAVCAPGQGRHAVTRATREAVFGTPPGAAHLSCRLETGRTHQIRVHLSHIGHALVGDPVYSGHRKLSPKSFSREALEVSRGFPRQALHAGTLGFLHPVTGHLLSFEAPMPKDMADLLSALGKT